MRAEPVRAEVVAAAFGEHADRNARGVRADDRPGVRDGFDPREQLLLDVEPLDDRFDDPVDVGELRQAVVEAAGGDQAMRRRA